jgi:hypothetical protein
MIFANGGTGEHQGTAHLTGFVGFFLTLEGIFWLLFSQNLDAQGPSRPWPFALGTMTTFLALSQTVTALIQEFLVGFAAAQAADPGIPASGHRLVPFEALGQIPFLILLSLGGAIWVLVTYAAPLITAICSPVRGGQRWVFAVYYCAFQIPICWAYASAWRLQYVPPDQPTNMLSLFAFQFIQPLLWLR